MAILSRLLSFRLSEAALDDGGQVVFAQTIDRARLNITGYIIKKIFCSIQNMFTLSIWKTKKFLLDSVWASNPIQSNLFYVFPFRVQLITREIS